jgi:hypothetical protein
MIVCPLPKIGAGFRDDLNFLGSDGVVGRLSCPGQFGDIKLHPITLSCMFRSIIAHTAIKEQMLTAAVF